MGFWIFWFAAGLCFVVLSTVLLIPRLMLKTYAATLPIRDKVIGRFTEEGRSYLLCRPSASVRRYISSYRVGQDAEGTYFCGEWARKVAFAVYEITVYGASNEIVGILRVKEKFNGGKTTAVTRLPEKADFVSLRLVCIDDTPFPAERRRFHARYAGWLAALCGALALTVDLLLWLGVTLVLRIFDRFTMTLTLPWEAWASLLGYAALGVVLVTVLVALARFFLLRRRRDSE